MKRAEILHELNDIFKNVLDEESIVLTESTSANDIESWDSLTHIQLIVAIEKKFNIRFTSKELLSLKNIGEIINCIVEK